MIIEYNSMYDEQIKDLFEELQRYITDIDKEGYNILTEKYKEKYFIKTISEIEKNQGKMFLKKQDNKIVGLVVGLINNEEMNEYDFKVPKRGRISELIVSKESRDKGIGANLLHAMEKYLKDEGCVDILIDVFAYNNKAIRFYEKNGYHNRMLEMTKSNFIEM